MYSIQYSQHNYVVQAMGARVLGRQLSKWKEVLRVANSQ